MLLAHLAEFDWRRLHERQGFPTLFEYCTRELGYSESSAGKRIVAARLARRLPPLLTRIASGKLDLTAVVILAPHLNKDNHKELLAQAEGKSTRELKFLLAGLAPRPDAPDCVRRLPAPSAAPKTGSDAPPPLFAPDGEGPGAETCGENPEPPPGRIAPGPKPLVEPLSPDRCLIRFTGGRELLALLDRAKEVLRHKYPDGDLEDVFTDALSALLDKKDPMRILQRKRKRRSPEKKGPAKRNGTGMSNGMSVVKHPRRETARRIPGRVRDAVVAREADAARSLERTADAARRAEAWSSTM
ncbi:MAG: hypothetical protein ABII00_17315 [Elusimicrobiota bacterium]